MKYEEHEEYKLALEVVVMFSKKYLNMLSKIDSKTYEEVKETPQLAHQFLKKLVDKEKPVKIKNQGSYTICSKCKENIIVWRLNGKLMNNYCGYCGQRVEIEHK